MSENKFIIPSHLFGFVCTKTQSLYMTKKTNVVISKVIQAQLELDPSLDYIELDSSDRAVKALVSYMEAHAGIESTIIPDTPLRSRCMHDICEDRFDAELINQLCYEGVLNDLYDLVNLALHLQIKQLLYLGCAKVSSLIKGQPLDQIRQILDPARTISPSQKDSTTLQYITSVKSAPIQVKSRQEELQDE